MAAGHKPGGNAAEGQIFLKARELSASCAACKEEKLRGVLGGFLQNWGLPETGGGLGRGQPPAAGLRGRGWAGHPGDRQPKSWVSSSEDK